MAAAPKITRLVETSLYVANLERSARFYSQVLGLEIESRLRGRHVFLIAGQSMLLLFDPKYLKREHEEEGEKALPQIYELGMTHIAFEIEPKNYDDWKETLRKNGVTIEAEKTWEKGNRSIYFRDPDGNVVELIEPGSWPIPRLRRPIERLEENWDLGGWSLKNGRAVHPESRFLDWVVTLDLGNPARNIPRIIQIRQAKSVLKPRFFPGDYKVVDDNHQNHKDNDEGSRPIDEKETKSVGEESQVQRVSDVTVGSSGHNPLRRVGVVEGAPSGREHSETLEVDNLGRQDQNHSNEPLERKSDSGKPENCS